MMKFVMVSGSFVGNDLKLDEDKEKGGGGGRGGRGGRWHGGVNDTVIRRGRLITISWVATRRK